MLLVNQMQPGERDQRVLDAVASVRPQAKIVQFLADTPSQSEDIIALLVDDDVVVSFELSRVDHSAPATEIEVEDVRTYARQVRGIHAKQLIKARAFAKAAVKRTSL